jgi:hypothetical protein
MAGCEVEGCLSPLHGNRWCQAHYRRFKKYGDPLGAAPVTTTKREECAVVGCAHPANGAKGLCEGHYYRLRRYGDPLAGRTANGATSAFLFSLLDVKPTGECVLWPYARTYDGYGKTFIDGAHISAHRAMCIMAHGQPPSDIHEAAHSCGNGHEGCVSPWHLRWATPAENAADKVAYGRQQSREAHPRAKLTEEAVAVIRRKETGVTISDLATKFGVSKSTVAMVRSGRNWRG